MTYQMIADDMLREDQERRKLLKRKLADGSAYSISMIDFEDRYGSAVATRWSSKDGILWASARDLYNPLKFVSVPLDTPMCGFCDAPIDGVCPNCGE